MNIVQAAIQSLVPQVDLSVLHQHRFDGLVALVLLEAVVEDLGVVRENPLRWVSEDEQQLDVGVHLIDAFRDLGRSEVGRRLFHRQLFGEGVRHLTEVPGQAFLKVTLPVEKVNFILSRHHGAVQTEHLNQSPRAPLPHADDYDLRKLLQGPIGVAGGAVVGGR